ncbi:MAG: hypothetical protein SFU91_07450 [Chloroherpetonaceae bacterium]|nr:hypothetical protein [Chloroherpetonaceae bacterium]
MKALRKRPSNVRGKRRSVTSFVTSLEKLAKDNKPNVFVAHFDGKWVVWNSANLDRQFEYASLSSAKRKAVTIFPKQNIHWVKKDGTIITLKPNQLSRLSGSPKSVRLRKDVNTVTSEGITV